MLYDNKPISIFKKVIAKNAKLIQVLYPNLNMVNAVHQILEDAKSNTKEQNEKEAWYLNPFASESQASFKINKSLNYWYLFSEGIGGNNTDFMKKYLNTSINEVLNWANNQNFSFK